MFTTLKKTPFLKGVSSNRIVLLPSSHNWLQHFAKSSGLKAKHQEVLAPADDLVVTNLWEQRREEAKRSLIVKIDSFKSWESLVGYCSTYGTVKKVFHYTNCNQNFVLLEMSEEQEFLKIVNSTYSSAPISNICEHFLLFSGSDRKTFEHKLTMSKLKDCFFKVSTQVNCEHKLKIELKKSTSISDKIKEIYDSMSVNDFGMRMRFLTCRQIELLFSGIIPNSKVYPFGSSVTGLGIQGCDLDLVVLPNENKPSSPLAREQSQFFNFDRRTVQLHLGILRDILSAVTPGCSDVIYIRNAKVPIVRYKQIYTALDCDLSLYNAHGVLTAKLLHDLTLIDNCIRPLVFVIKLWAKQTQLVYKNISGLSSFSLTLLVLFFLQQPNGGPPILPPFNIFLKNKMILNDNKIWFSLMAHKYSVSEEGFSKQSLENLLYNFFDYYSTFNFKDTGISLTTGKVLKNALGIPLLIENPLDISLNVSKNVSFREIKKFQLYVNTAKIMLLRDDKKFSTLFDSSYYNQNNDKLFSTKGKTVLSFLKKNIVRTRTPIERVIKFFTILHLRLKNHNTEVTIGDVKKKINPPKKPQYIPHKYLSMGELSQNTLKHLRWMLQKDLLKQDIFLIGRPGPIRRQLAMCFLEMTSREVEYVALSRDTTEADLKQRREIQGGTARYLDQNAVRAAIEGRVLILEGIEKAERNVLPVLNNLLENREMHLEDGRFLIPASRYDKLLKEHSKEELDKWNLVRVHDEFRVIALGLPVPKYSGNPLDPPLRSRFQARNISFNTFQEQFVALKERIAPNSHPEKITQLLSCAYALTTEESMALGLPDFPIDNIPKLGQILNQFPNIEIFDLFNRLYPYSSFLSKEGTESIRHFFETFKVKEQKSSGNKLNETKCSSETSRAMCNLTYNSSQIETQVPCGLLSFDEVLFQYVPTDFQENLMVELLQSHAVSDFCLIGPKGCGKSATVLRLAKMLNYEVEPIVLYQDITSRDLIQQRTTLANGDTVWNNSPLIKAALDGKMAILDGIDRVHPSTLSVIHSLVQDRDVQLYDGKRLVRHDRYDEIKEKHGLSDEEMATSGILKVHPSFRIVALAESGKKGVNQNKWLSAEMLSLFLFHEMRPLSSREENLIIQNLYGSTNEKIDKILNFAVNLRNSTDPTLASISPFFSTRQLLRISKRLSKYSGDSVHDSLQKACLARFLPSLTKDALDKIMKKEGIEPEPLVEQSNITCTVDDKTVKIGATEVKRYETKTKSKVPDILFYDVPQHLALLEWLIQDFTLGEHILLVGNQGVGKNKIADRLLQLLNRPREYIQLHRDTTVQTLTLQTTVKDGIVSFEDSPLVQAVKSGHVLVVDEADKAPTHVTCILKTMVERGEMTLSDGRKILPFGDPRAKKPNMIEVHPDFRMIVLANRPGFPFLGNDFFGALGDLFSCHAVDNPSPESEIALLKQYGPDVPEDTILKLVRAFGELRTMADKGSVQYPYSTREVVNIVKHLQNFPGELLSNVVSNVFDFDKYSQNALETVIPILQKNGIPVETDVNNVTLAREFSLPKMSSYGQWSVNKISRNSGTPVEIKNIKLSEKKYLSSTMSEIDVTEARGSGFSELYSYSSLPMPIGNVALGLAVTKDEKSKDLVTVLTINPFRLYVTNNTSRNVKILELGSLLPRLGYSGRYRFNLTTLTGELRNFVLIQEENMNFLLLVNVEENVARLLDLKSMSEKLLKVFNKQTYVTKWKLNSQMANKNKIVLYPLKQGFIEVLDLNRMVSHSLVLPLEIKSLQLVSNDKWLLQNSDDGKYLLMKNNPKDPVPSKLYQISESTKGNLNMGTIIDSTSKKLEDDVLKKILEEDISAPNRLLLTDECHAVVAVGFPDLELSSNEIYYWPRIKNIKGWTDLQGNSVFLKETLQVVTPVSKTMVPREVRDENGLARAFLEVLDLKRRSLQYIPIPQGHDSSWYVDTDNLGIYLSKMNDEELVTVDFSGNIHYWETGYLNLKRSLDDWTKLVGKEKENIQLTVQRDSGMKVSSPKHGKVDPKNKPHVGGNTWAGGTGGRDTAGLGGKGGPYRLDAGHDVHQISDYEKEQVPEEVKRAAREMGSKAFKKRLKEIQMSQYDHETYLNYYTPVAPQIKILKTIIENVQRKSKEREWVRHQTSGNLDDLKLIEGLTGEKTIYRRRAEKEPEPGAPMTKPKCLKLVADVSGSMLRFNGYDGRLNRMLEASVLVMEAFQDQEGKFKYDITGHSGDGYNIPFVSAEKPPKNNKERLTVINTMYAHAQFCMSGDHTLPATQSAIEIASKESCDEAIVIVFSDANLERYGIRPSSFAKILTSNPDVNAYAILIGSLGDQAERLASTLPAGRAFVCMDLSDIPRIMQQIFTTSVLSST